MKTATKHTFNPRAAALAIGVACVGVFGGSATAQAAGCPNADLQPVSAADVPAAQAATRCLVSRERSVRGLRSLKDNKKLQRSSDWQSNDMFSNQYFAHDRKGGPSFDKRITRFGYGKKAAGYSLAENIAWSTTGSASPSEIVALWMDSPGHRLNILHKTFREQAVSALFVEGPLGGDYDDSGPLVIYVNQFGVRF